MAAAEIALLDTQLGDHLARYKIVGLFSMHCCRVVGENIMKIAQHYTLAVVYLQTLYFGVSLHAILLHLMQHSRRIRKSLVLSFAR